MTTNLIKTMIAFKHKLLVSITSGLRRGFAANATIKIEKPYKIYLLDIGPDTKVTLAKDDALLYYREMFSIRRNEQKCVELYADRQIRGFCHLYPGQEACAVGIKAAMRKMDSLITSYRCHAWLYLLGIPMDVILAELMGRSGGVSRGRGGSIHMYTKNFFGGNGIVGAQIPLGTGTAFAHKYLGTNGVSFILYGDGAANQGQVFESYNMAKLYGLPAVFVTENNRYGMGTEESRASASIEFYKRAGGYIPGIWANGMDVLAVREAARFCVAHIIAGKGPILLELDTYRYFGHSMSDPGTSYRSREEVNKVRSTRDPIKHLKDKIISEKLATGDDLKKIEKECQKRVDDAEAKAKKSPEPQLDQLAEDVYLKPLVTDIRGVDPFTTFKHKNVGKPITHFK